MNQSINIAQVTRIAGDVLTALPKLAPWLLLLVLTLRLTRDAIVGWRKPVDLQTAQTVAWFAGAAAALAYAGVKL